MSTQTPTSMFAPALVVPAIGESFRKLDPRQLVKNPVMFVTAVVAVLLTVLLVIGQSQLAIGFQLQLIVWLWLTVLFGTFAEALAEGRGRAQAASLRHGDRQTAVGDGVHGRGHDGDVQPDLPREACRGVNLTRHDFRGARFEQNIVEGEPFANLHETLHFAGRL